MDIPFLIAHRGCRHDAPENTLEAFQKAGEAGFKMCEFDIQLSLDDQIVVIHDETLDRTTQGSGRVRDFNLSQIQQFGPVPTLSEVSELCEKLDMAMNIEIKRFEDVQQNIKTAKLLIQWLNNYQKNAPEFFKKILISSFEINLLYLVREVFSEINLGYLLFLKEGEDWDLYKPKVVQQVKELNCLSLNINQDILTPVLIQKIKSQFKVTLGHQILLLAYTVNDPERALLLKNNGVNGIFTDLLSFQNKLE